MADIAIRNAIALNPEIDSRFLCCCGRVHIVTGAVVVGIIDLMIMILSITINGPIAVIAIVLAMFIIGSMFYGIHMTEPAFVIPYLVWLPIRVIVLSVLFLYTLIASIILGYTTPLLKEWARTIPEKLDTVDEVDKIDDAMLKQTATAAEEILETVEWFVWIKLILTMIYLATVCALCIWFYCVVSQLYDYLRAKRYLRFGGQAYALGAGAFPGIVVAPPGHIMAPGGVLVSRPAMPLVPIAFGSPHAAAVTTTPNNEQQPPAAPGKDKADGSNSATT